MMQGVLDASALLALLLASRHPLMVRVLKKRADELYKFVG